MCGRTCRAAARLVGRYAAGEEREEGGDGVSMGGGVSFVSDSGAGAGRDASAFWDSISKAFACARVASRCSIREGVADGRVRGCIVQVATPSSGR